MKTLLAFVAGVSIVGILVLASVGALRVRNAGDEVQITIDKTKDLGERPAKTTREIFSPSQADDAAPHSDPQANPQRPDASAETSEDHEETSEKEQASEVR